MNRLRNRKIAIFLIIFLFLVFIICFFMMVRFRGSVKVYPDRNIILSDDYVLYRQDDPLWADDHLGDSSFTMKDSGCLVTCIAAVMGVTPKTLNERFTLYDVYDSEGNLIWGNLKNIDETYHVEVFSEVSEELLMNCLEDGRFPIVRVRVYGIGNFHYVLIVKAEEGVFYCMDPLQDELMPLSTYGNRIYAIRSVY